MACNKYSNFVVQKIVPIVSEKTLVLFIQEIFSNFLKIINSNIGLSFIKNIIITIKSSETKMFFTKQLLSIANFILEDIKGANFIFFTAEKFDSVCKIEIIEFLLKNYSPYFIGNYADLCLTKCIKITEYKYLKSIYTYIFFDKNYFKQICSTVHGQMVISEFFKKLNSHKKDELYKIIISYCDDHLTPNSIRFLEEYL